MSWGARTIGYVNNDRREISICALPPHVSLSALLIKSGSPADYGARRGTQWPHLAVRRFLLYNTFLRELGHMQLVNAKSKTNRRKYAGERKSYEFAKYWRKKLWGNHFDHPDKAHNPPAQEELLM